MDGGRPGLSKMTGVRKEVAQGNGQLAGYLALFFIFICSLTVRLWLLDKRWINPDEGAHLMDGLLTLQGYIPQVDFGARQTVYVLANAVWLKVWGMGLLYGRLFPMTCSLLTGILVFLIARKLFHEKIALLAAIVYLLLPLEILNSVVVKTEPLANVLACASFYMLLLYRGERNRFFLLLAGFFAALGYYVRESLLFLPLLGLVLIVTENERKISASARAFGWYLLGYALVVIPYLAFYLQFTAADELLYSKGNPVGLILNAANKVWHLLSIKIGMNSGITGEASGKLGTKTIYSFHYLKWTVFLHLFLFIGVAWATLRVVFKGRAISILNPLYGRSYFLSLNWVALLAIAYLYYYKTFGYYIDYFREFLPILVILFAAYTWETIFRGTRNNTWVYSSIIIATGLAAIFIVGNSGINLPKGVQIVVVTGALAIVLLLREKMRMRSRVLAIFSVAVFAFLYILSRAVDAIPNNIALVFVSLGMVGITTLLITKRLRFLNLSLVLNFLVLSTTFAASTMDMRYDSIWSIDALRKITAVIEGNSEPGDAVMSGAVIWDFESHRRPVAMISHPLTYRYRMRDEVTARIEQDMRLNPPQIIVLDGYTEKIYLLHLKWLQDIVDNKYELIMENDQAKYPVRVFRLKKGE